MRRHEAKDIARTITYEQLAEAVFGAMESIKDWGQISKTNRGLTIGQVSDILVKWFTSKKSLPEPADRSTGTILAIANCIREFEEFLPDNVKYPLS